MSEQCRLMVSLGKVGYHRMHWRLNSGHSFGNARVWLFAYCLHYENESRVFKSLLYYYRIFIHFETNIKYGSFYLLTVTISLPVPIILNVVYYTLEITPRIIKRRLQCIVRLHHYIKIISGLISKYAIFKVASYL